MITSGPSGHLVRASAALFRALFPLLGGGAPAVDDNFSDFVGLTVALLMAPQDFPSHILLLAFS